MGGRPRDDPGAPARGLTRGEASCKPGNCVPDRPPPASGCRPGQPTRRWRGSVFVAMHVYWFAGGSVGRAGPLPDPFPDSASWIFEVLVISAFSFGAWVCLAIARRWPRGRMRHVAATLVWLGCALLAVRGGAGLIDDLTRAASLLPDGITSSPLRKRRARPIRPYPSCGPAERLTPTSSPAGSSSACWRTATGHARLRRQSLRRPPALTSFPAISAIPAR